MCVGWILIGDGDGDLDGGCSMMGVCSSWVGMFEVGTGRVPGIGQWDGGWGMY